MSFLHCAPWIRTRYQQGIVGIFLSAVLSAALVVAGSQGTKKANMNAYHTGTKSSIEEANQLMQSGLKYTALLIQNKTMLETLVNKYKNNPSVIVACQKIKEGEPTPETVPLIPSVVVENLWTPDSSNQDIQIKAAFQAYNCKKNFSLDNYLAAFEVIGGSGCKNSSVEQNKELCSTRAVVMTSYKGTEYTPFTVIKTPKPETETKTEKPKSEPETEKPKTEKPKTETKTESKPATEESTTTTETTNSRRNVGL